jgi:aspartate dehydrogenase
MKLAIMGSGAIGRYAMKALAKAGPGVAAVLYRSDPGPLPPGAVAAQRVADLPDGVTHLLDCAGHSGLAAHGPAALAAGIDVVSLSLGALADTGLAGDLEAAARAGGARLHLCSGAIGGLDALRAAAVGGLESVRYTGRKPPAGWRGSPAAAALDLETLTEAAIHFEGDARAAALLYPKNANVAAAVALSGLGFEATEVRLVADPAAAGNSHTVEATGAFGRFRFEITGAALPDNPKSSALAAMSAVAELRRLAAPIST